MLAPDASQATTEPPKRSRGRPRGSKNKIKTPPAQSNGFTVQLNVQPTELNGEHWVSVTVGGQNWKKFGPFPDASTAATKAQQLAQNWGGIPAANSPALAAVATNDNFVTLHGKLVALDSDEGRRFVLDCTRSGEGAGLNDADVIDRWEISVSEWEAIKTNVKLGRAIRECGRQRRASGQKTVETANEYFTKSPKILDQIQSSAASPRHVVEAIRELRAISSSRGNESPADAANHYVIRIDLTAARDGEVIEIAGTANQPKQIESNVDAEQ
jgi:hypothetical protein